ncbi:uncharacterized protein LOC135209218 isoform X1 [Macrobrachium nipponense]|uniref:uncharacterized protein LOC135209218 isoform X1 n=1 Tax=Macrobrachium nipponense TaxID=159736 RepID=UPI0030C7ACD8
MKELFLFVKSLCWLLCAAALFSGCAADGELEEDSSLLLGELGNVLYDQCSTEDTNFPYGSCMLPQECDLIGGTTSGSCAEGLGSCCIVKKSCGESTAFNNSYFVHPEESHEGACALTIQRMNEDICQVRLDFLELRLSQPDWDGHCNDDFLTVTGEASNPSIPIICGHNDGQHMYVEVAADGGVLELVVDSALPSSGRSWRIQVTQIGCDSRYLAPSGCLQYYTESVGNVSSFNFLHVPVVPPAVPATSQIANHNYGICVRRMPGYCGIVWARDFTTDYSFTVSGDVNALMPGFIGDPASCSTGSDCPSDYVIIPGGYSEDFDPEQGDRFCGLGFPNSVMSTSAPFVLYVRTDDTEAGDGGNLGFSFNYRQVVDC